MAVKFSVNITSGAAPFVEIAPQMCTFSGCFGLGLSFLGWPALLHVFHFLSIITVHLSDHMTSLKFSWLIVCCRHHESRFHLLFCRII